MHIHLGTVFRQVKVWLIHLPHALVWAQTLKEIGDDNVAQAWKNVDDDVLSDRYGSPHRVRWWGGRR